MSSFAPLIAIGPNHRMRDSVFDLTESVANKRGSERAHARNAGRVNHALAAGLMRKHVRRRLAGRQSVAQGMQVVESK